MPTVRPPSVDAVLRATDGALDGRDRAAVVADARRVVATERERLAAGAAHARRSSALAVLLAERLR